MSKTIRIRRNTGLLPGRQEAIQFLNTTKHMKGQPMAAYYRVPGRGSDLMLAVGLSDNAYGPGAYRVMSVSGICLVNGVAFSDSQVPDITGLMNGEVWLYSEPITNNLFWIRASENKRVLEAVDPGTYYRVISMADQSEYVIIGGVLSRTGDHYSREEIDRRLLGVTGDLQTLTEQINTTVSNGLSGILTGTGLSMDGAYTGGITGASSLMEADKVLQTKVNGSLTKLEDLQAKVNLLESELISGVGGLTGETRLDKVYDWYTKESARPSYKISYHRLDTTPLVSRSTHYIRVVFEWTRLDYFPEITGIRIGTKETLFEDGGPLQPKESEDGRYEETLTWNITDSIAKTWTSEFIGSGASETYTLTPEPEVRNITYSLQDHTWKPFGQGHTLGIKFEGTGLPGATSEGEDMIVNVNGNIVHRGTTTTSPTQSREFTYSMIGTTVVSSTWGKASKSIIFTPVTLTQTHRDGTSVTWTRFLSDTEDTIDTPSISFEAGDTLTYREGEEEDMGGYKVTYGGHVIEDTNTRPGTITLKNIGRGTFKFNIQRWQ